MFTKSVEKWSLLGVVRCFRRVLENYDCRTKFNPSIGMEYNGELYGFSAVKVKLVHSFEIVRSHTGLKHHEPL